MSGDICKPSPFSRVPQVDASSQQALQSSDWVMLNLGQTFSIVDQMAELSSVENFICILQKCRKEKNLAYAKRLHAQMCNNGFEAHKTLGNYIVPMFVECGSMPDAWQVFNRLVHRNEHSWTSLMLGYIYCDQSQHAFRLYENMQADNVRPSKYTLMALLKACSRLRDVERGRKLHLEIVQKGLDADVFVGSTLIDMYAKCGLLSEAREVFDKLPVRTVVSWTALIAGYAEHGSAQQVVKCFEQMQVEGISPDAVTFVCILKACGSIGAIETIQEIHAEIMHKGFDTHIFLGSTLVAMYAKCGALLEAQKVFDKLPIHNVVSWTALMVGYAEYGPGEQVLKCFEQMQLEDISPDAVTYACVLKACSSIKAIDKGREIHREITEKGFCIDTFLGSTLIDMYAKCGSLTEAQKVFDKLSVRDVILWNALIAGYAEYGNVQKALKHFVQMQIEHVSPDPVTYVCILKACGSIGFVEKGREIHMEIMAKGFERDILVANSLISMYAKCGLVSEAQELFDKLPVRDVVSWTALIGGYAEHGPCQKALIFFEKMQLEGITVNAFTFVCGLKACGSIGAIDKGREMHAEITNRGFENDLFVGNALIDMYSKCGSLLEGQEVFNKLAVRDAISWNALIGGYVDHGFGQEALNCIEHMQMQGISLNAATFVYGLKACGSIGSIDKGRELHVEITRKGFDRDVFVGSTLVDMYAKCGSPSEARKAFEKLPVQNIVSWNALIAGYAEHGPAQEAVKCFELMQLKGMSACPITYACILKACGSIGAIDKGKEIHGEIIQKGFERDAFVGSTLIDMYAKCGSLALAQEVFHKLPVRNAVSWTAMINGYGMNHEGNMAVQCFEDMQKQGVKPNTISFTCLITACSRASLVLKGWEYFNLMKEEYGMIPTVDHYNCMVDLLARSGHLHEAERFLKTMPCLPSIETWTALLSACKTYGETEIGLRCFQQLVKMCPENAVSYVLMGNIYANAGRKDDAFRIEALRKVAGAMKKPASALIEVNKKIYEFMVGNNQSKEISALLEILSSCMEEEGYLPNLDLDLKSISNEEKESALCEHAEKLAIAFGLLNTPHGQTLRVIKNMRMCNNCHNANKIISMIERREIIVRDSYCVHHFKDGLCSCRVVL